MFLFYTFEKTTVGKKREPWSKIDIIVICII